ncbi:hypothetical protein Bca101_043588 [Brassica carinata]
MPYHKPHAIRQILNALYPEEVNIIRGSPFGKLVEIGEKPSFSGRFGRFIISRQLKVEKKHEAWFIFAGKPEVPVTSVVKMLKKITVTDRDMRVKYALLALLAVVILPTTHTPRISQEHAERIKNIDDFFAYPWGRISFDMLMSSMKERKEVSLSQNTIALKGFVLSLQLVMVEAIPALTEVVNDESSSGSEGDGGEEDDLADEDKNGKRTISPNMLATPTLRERYMFFNVAVRSVIVEDKEHFKVSPDLCWSDDEEDPIVDNLMCLVEQRFPFNNSSFIGGVTMAEVNRMREEAKSEAINRKAVKPKQTKQTTPSEAIDCEAVASIVSDKVREDLSLMERRIISLSEAFLTFQTKVLDNFQLLLRQVKGPTDQTRDSSTVQHGNVSNDARDVQQPLIKRHTFNHIGIQTDYAENVIIAEAIRFTNQTTSTTVDGLQDVQRMQSGAPTEGQTPRRILDGMDSPNQLHCHDDTILHKPTTLVTDDGVNGDQVIQPEVPTEDQSMLDSDKEKDTDEPADPFQFSNQANAIVVDVLDGSKGIQSSIQAEDEMPYDSHEETANTSCVDVLNGAQQIHSSIDNGGPTMRMGAEKICAEKMVSCNPPVSLVVDTPLDQEGNVSDTSQSSLLTNLDPALLFPKPTFSLGLTQEERHHPKEKVTEGESVRENVPGSEICEQDDQVVGCRKSKRLKAIPESLVGQYECDMRLLNRARVALVDTKNTGGNIDYSAKLSALLDKLKSPFTIRIGQSTLESNDLYELVQRSNPLQPKVVDILMGHIRSQFTINSPANQSNHPVFLDTQFVSQLSKLFPKFSKCPKKDSFRFLSNILERFLTQAGQLCDGLHALRTDNMMVKEVSPISQMLPYLLKQGGKQIVHKDARALPIERPRTIPQNTSPADSAVSAVLLLQAHAVAGVDVCKCITPEAIGSEVERLAVMFYEAIVGML